MVKCPVCNGVGQVEPMLFNGYPGYTQYCPQCKGSGEVLTEQEYIQTCNTEQLAEVLSNISTDAWVAGLNNMDRPVGQKDNWQQWLKQPHIDKE